jgi:hypothetical protein
VTADVIVLDEAAFISKDLFYKVIGPITTMKMTSFIALSSPSDPNNFFSRLIRAKDRYGRQLMRYCDYQLLCEDCAKLEDQEEQLKCDHVKPAATWINQEKVQRMQDLLATDPATALQELKGVIADTNIPCFDRKALDVAFSLPPLISTTRPPFVFITTDPSGGGVSQLAVCASYYDSDLNYVVRTQHVLFTQRLLQVSESLNNVVLSVSKFDDLRHKSVCSPYKPSKVLSGIGKDLTGSVKIVQL